VDHNIVMDVKMLAVVGLTAMKVKAGVLLV
jgi:hypothetical protein